MTCVTNLGATKLDGPLTKERLVGFRPRVDEVALGKDVKQSCLQKLLRTQPRLCYANQEGHFCFVDVEWIQVI